MDKLTQYLLSLGTAILFPIVVVFGVFTIVPDPELPQYPRTPSNSCYATSKRCTQQQKDIYKAEKVKADEARAAYDAAVNSRAGNNRTRAEIALGVSIVTFIVAVAMRAVSKEMVAGLVLGSSLCIVVAAGVISSEITYLDETTPRLIGVMLITSGFVVLTGVIAVIDKTTKNDAAVSSGVTGGIYNPHQGEDALATIPGEHPRDTKQAD